MDAQPKTLEPPGGQKCGLRRWLPLAAVLLAMVLVFASGLHTYLSFKAIGLNYDLLKGFIAGNTIAALLIYMLVYVAVVALSLPGGLVMTLAGGLLFGWKLGAPATIVAATIGATALFLAAKTSFGEQLAAKAGPSLAALRDGFKDNALSYLLFLRLVPAFPFVIVNLAPALLGVPLKTYVLGTFLGIIPGTIAFSFAGAGLGSVVEAQNKSYQDCLAGAPANPETACPYNIDTSALVTRELLVAFALLGVVALIPVVLKRWKGRHAPR
ncbi:MAG: TVP38/TMEM64 family protein [Hyphomicrobium sp.]